MGLSDRNCVVKEQKAGLDNTAIFWLKRTHSHWPGDPQCRVPSMLSPRRERTSGQLTPDVAEDQTEKLSKVDSQNITSKYSCVNPKGETKSPATLVYSLRGVDSEKKQISGENKLQGHVRSVPRTHHTGKITLSGLTSSLSWLGLLSDAGSDDGLGSRHS